MFEFVNHYDMIIIIIISVLLTIYIAYILLVTYMVGYRDVPTFNQTPADTKIEYRVKVWIKRNGRKEYLPEFRACGYYGWNSFYGIVRYEWQVKTIINMHKSKRAAYLKQESDGLAVSVKYIGEDDLKKENLL